MRPFAALGKYVVNFPGTGINNRITSDPEVAMAWVEEALRHGPPRPEQNAA